MSHPGIFVGSVLEFTYPIENRRRSVCSRSRRRRAWVASIRDCEEQPIEDWAIRLCPDLRRGRFLLRCFDLDRYGERSFYLSSAQSLREVDIPVRRLALYDPLGDGQPIEWVGPLWTDSPGDSVQIAEAVRLYNEMTASNLVVNLALGVFEVTGATVFENSESSADGWTG